MRRNGVGLVMGLALLWVMAWVCERANAHCDTLDGPVVKDARVALEKADVTPVLKWVKKDAEAEIKAAFQKTLTVRKAGKDAQDLADQFFFETLIRVHRAGEGAPYTGLKPAGSPLEPGVAEADKALASGSSEELVKGIQAHLATEIEERFSKVLEAKKHADESVDAGRKYVEAYVEYVHFVERLHADMAGHVGHHEGAKASEDHEGEHEH